MNATAKLPIVGDELARLVKKLHLHTPAEDTLVSLCNRADNGRKPIAISVQSPEAQRLLPHLRGHLEKASKLLGHSIGISNGELTVSPFNEKILGGD